MWSSPVDLGAPPARPRAKSGSALFLHFPFRGRVQAQAADAASVAVQDFEFPAALRMLDDLARFGNAARNHEGQAAQRVDILLDLRQLFVGLLGDILQFGAGVGLPDRKSTRLNSRH